MTLIFGGTTEGRRAAEMLDLLSEPYIYSTKEAVHQQIRGRMIFGPLDEEKIVALCRNECVKIIIDAAHPFALVLHHHIHQASLELEIPIIRMERIYIPLEGKSNIKIFSSFDEMNTMLNSMPRRETILSLTGVQTINRFIAARDKHSFFFRILNTELSWHKALQSGINTTSLIPGPPQITLENLLELIECIKPTIMLTKESGESGFFNIKMKAAEIKNIPLWVVQRPPSYETPNRTTSDKTLLQCFLKLRKEHLKNTSLLRTGYTTGSCVTIAAAASFKALMHDYFEKTQDIILPDSNKIELPLFDCIIKKNQASCIVIKDAGDDPDVTHAAEIGCQIKLVTTPGITFKRGKGIGIVTIPGLQVSVGQPAINPTPRQMIHQTLLNMAQQYNYIGGWEVTPFIPQGEELAQKTFNPRIGVMGGLSILGTSGYVRPYSSEAFLNAMGQQINVAYRHNKNIIVLTAGKRSEQVLQPLYPQLNSTSFVHYGNSVGDAVSMCNKIGFKQIVIGMMPGKAIKLAEGHLDTHSKHHTFNALFAADIARLNGYANTICQVIKETTLVNAIDAIIPFSDEEPFYTEIVNRCTAVIAKNVDSDVLLELYLINPSNHQWINNKSIDC